MLLLATYLIWWLGGMWLSLLVLRSRFGTLTTCDVVVACVGCSVLGPLGAMIWHERRGPN
jgi:hypothetical protein